MADWRALQQGLLGGFQTGMATGGKMAGIGSAISKVANKLKEERLAGQDLASKENLLGFQGLMSGTIEPSAEGAINVPGIGRVSQVGASKEWKPTTKAEALEYENEKYGLKSQNRSAVERKAEFELEESQRKRDFASSDVMDKANDALNTIREIEGDMQYFGMATGYPGKLPSFPGHPRSKWEANVNKLLAGKVISVMTDMKNASRTGATGFGQLSEKELKVLQDASTALNRNLSPKDAQVELNKMKASLQKISNSSTSEQGEATSVDSDYQRYLKSIGE